MKCPHCKQTIGSPFLLGPFQGIPSAFITCPKCMGKITYSFSGKKVAAYSVPTAFVCWVASRYLGDAIFLVFPLLILLPAKSPQKWY